MGPNWFQILSRKKYAYAFVTCVGFVPYIHHATVLFKIYFKVIWQVSVYSKVFIILLFSHFSSFPFFCCHHYLPSKHLNWQFIIISVYLFKLTSIQIAMNKGSVHVIDVCTANCLFLCARQVAEWSITSKIPFFRMDNLPSALLSIRNALRMVQKCC